MSAGRNWYFFTVAIAALSLGLDAGAQKPSFDVPKIPDLKPGWAGTTPGWVPVNPGKGPSSPSGNPAGGGTQFERGAVGNTPSTVSRGGSSAGSSSSGQAGNGPDKSNKGGGGHAPGKDNTRDSPGENVHASTGEAENAIPKGRAPHAIPTCK